MKAFVCIFVASLVATGCWTKNKDDTRQRGGDLPACNRTRDVNSLHALPEGIEIIASMGPSKHDAGVAIDTEILQDLGRIFIDLRGSEANVRDVWLAVTCNVDLVPRKKASLLVNTSYGFDSREAATVRSVCKVEEGKRYQKYRVHLTMDLHAFWYDWGEKNPRLSHGASAYIMLGFDGQVRPRDTIFTELLYVDTDLGTARLGDVRANIVIVP